MQMDNIGKDYLKINIEMVEFVCSYESIRYGAKYIGSEGKVPKIHKLGGTEWTKTKTRAKKAVVDLGKI